jgi:hypothetical protein
MIRYYPSFAVKNNLRTTGNEYTLNGVPYVGAFYQAYNGDAYTGPNPINGKNQLLKPIKYYNNSPFLTTQKLTETVRQNFAQNTFSLSNALNNTEPTPYYPQPLDTDYQKGYIIRYFAKKINSKGYVIEVSPQEYTSFINGTVQYDVSFYQMIEILWKISGPLNTVRLSQYDIREGIIQVNKRLTLSAEPNFIGITDFIGGDYTKFAKPTV